MMRRYFAKVVDPNGHPSLKEEHVQIQDKPFASLEVGEEGIVQLRNRKTQELYKVTMIGLGYHDFEDKEDYEENVGDVVEEKLDEHGIEHSIGEED